MTIPTLIEIIQAARDVERYEGENASFTYGLTNCSRCKKLSRDYLIIGNASPVCTECASFQESYRLGKCNGANSTHDRLAPALICAVEALEKIERAYATHGERMGHQDYALSRLTRIREILEGKVPKV